MEDAQKTEFLSDPMEGLVAYPRYDSPEFNSWIENLAPEEINLWTQLADEGDVAAWMDGSIVEAEMVPNSIGDIGVIGDVEAVEADAYSVILDADGAEPSLP